MDKRQLMLTGDTKLPIAMVGRRTIPAVDNPQIVLQRLPAAQHKFEPSWGNCNDPLGEADLREILLGCRDISRCVAFGQLTAIPLKCFQCRENWLLALRKLGF